MSSPRSAFLRAATALAASFITAFGALGAEPTVPVLKPASHPVRTLRHFQNAHSLPNAKLDLAIVCNVIAVRGDDATFRDESATLTLRIEPAALAALRPGDRVLLKGDGGAPMSRFPDFPSQIFPLQRLEEEIREAPPLATRVRVGLRAPVSGAYQFWIASDDESELWLSPDGEPDRSIRIARVDEWTGATAPREWEKTPGQRSDPIALREGEICHLEIIHRNIVGPAHWAVAWKGPGFARTIVGAEHLVPLDARSNPLPGTVLAERWTPYHLPSLTHFRAAGPVVIHPAEIRNLVISPRGKALLGIPRAIHPGESLGHEEILPFIEVRGVVTRAETSFTRSLLELSWNGRKLNVDVANPERRSVKSLLGRFVSVRGFCSTIVDSSQQRVAGAIEAVGLHDIQLSASPAVVPSGPLYHPAELAAPPSTLWSEPSVRAVGVVRRLPDASFVLEGEQLTEIVSSVSDDGVEWRELGRARMPLKKDVHAGLTATAYHSGKVTEAVFGSLRGFDQTLRSGDLGVPPQPGYFMEAGPHWVLQASGKDIWNDTQEGHFASAPMSDDFEVSVRCESLKDTGQWAKAGLMIRENLTERSPYALLAVVPGRLAMFQFRESSHGLSSPVVTAPATLPCWLRLRLRKLVSVVPIEPVSHEDALPEGTRVEAVGALEWTAGRARLADAFLRPLNPGEAVSNPTESSRTLRTVREARQISGSGQSYLVELRGVVTSARTLQDETGAIYLADLITNCRGGKSALPGDFVELAGTTRENPSSISIQPILTRILGKGAMPDPRRFVWADLITGAADGLWIEQEGVVRSIRAESFELLIAGGSIEVINPWAKLDLKLLPGAAGSPVTVRGICWMEFDAEGRPSRVRIAPPSVDSIHLGRRRPGNPFDAPPIEISEMIRAAAAGPLRHRTIRGITTYVDGRTLYLQNGNGAVRIETVSPSALLPGANVEAAGIPFLPGGPMPCLAFAEVRKIGDGILPAPRILQPSDLEQYVPKAERIALDANVLEMRPSGNGFALILSCGPRILHASMADSSLRGWSLPEGTLVRVQGIATSNSEALHLLLRDKDDVQILQWPARVKRERMLMLAAALIMAAAIAFLIGLLRSRRRLREQIASRRKAEAEFEAVEGERVRLASELHDTLEQSLTGVAFRLLAASKSFEPNRNASRKHLEEARALLNESQLEVRRSVWNLRAKALDEADLPEALSSVGDQLASAANVKFELHTEGRHMRLPEFLESHLLRIGQEAITNAVKHAGASEIEVRLRYARDSIRLSVTDDGQGMDASARLGRKGHFGLLGMTERAAKIDGTLTIDSCSGRTTIMVEAPAMEDVSSS